MKFSGTSLPTTRSFLSNISSTYSSEYEFCGLHQAIDEDYKGNTGDLNIDRGHVVPNAIENGLILQSLKSSKNTQNYKYSGDNDLTLKSLKS